MAVRLPRVGERRDERALAAVATALEELILAAPAGVEQRDVRDRHERPSSPGEVRDPQRL
jgi:hypothetical protein